MTMKTLLLACGLASLSMTARADATAPATVCVIEDGQGDWAIVTTDPAGPTIVTVHLVNVP